MNLPNAFTGTIQDLFNADQARALLEAIEAGEPPVSIRINPRKWVRELPLDRVLWSDHAYYLPERPVFTKDPLFHAGAYYVQEASSMILGNIFRQIRKDSPVRVLDLCAAPGGKSTQLLAELQPGDLLVSNEVIRSRATVLMENLAKWGSFSSMITSDDPRSFGRLKGFFDVLVVDAPCSGEGMFRKDEAAIGEWSPEHVQLCHDRQQRILQDAWDCLAADGVLIYSTCTFNRQENEEILEWMFEQFEVTGVDLDFLDDFRMNPYEVRGAQGYKMLPGTVQGEGFSFFVLRKTDGYARLDAEFPGKKKKKGREKLSKPGIEIPGLRQQDSMQVTEQEGKILVLPFPEELEMLKEKVRVIRSGIWIGDIKKKLIPGHEWAMSELLDPEAWPQMKLDYQQALSYLMKEPFHLEGSPSGFVLVTHNGLPLGWINHLGNRFNNLYPASWRIQRDFRNEDSFSIGQLTL